MARLVLAWPRALMVSGSSVSGRSAEAATAWVARSKAGRRDPAASRNTQAGPSISSSWAVWRVTAASMLARASTWGTSSCHCGQVAGSSGSSGYGALGSGESIGGGAGLVGAGEPVSDDLLQQPVDTDPVAGHRGERVAVQGGEGVGYLFASCRRVLRQDREEGAGDRLGGQVGRHFQGRRASGARRPAAAMEVFQVAATVCW